MPLGIGSFAKDYGWGGKTADAWRKGMTALAQSSPNVYVRSLACCWPAEILLVMHHKQQHVSTEQQTHLN